MRGRSTEGGYRLYRQIGQRQEYPDDERETLAAVSQDGWDERWPVVTNPVCWQVFDKNQRDRKTEKESPAELARNGSAR